MTDRTRTADRPGPAPAGATACGAAASGAADRVPSAGAGAAHTGESVPVGCAPMFSITMTPRDPYARLARGCRPRGCRAPARRVHGRRVRYVIGDEPGQVNGMRWPRTRTRRRPVGS
ncbi:tryptophan biosynthesis modulator TrpM [Streptomyces gottesmaniae]|uniref:tryptophan biosynthesis modulator TrpM n=1 Tax=Streptomyces gottesmaniae TaxID=3075518 RepID=UPI000A66A183